LYWGTGGNPDLNPETGWSYELNFEGAAPKKKSRLTFDYNLGGYFNNVKNWILWTPGSNGLWSVGNVSHVHAYGIEAQANTAYRIKNFTLGISPRYNYNTSREVETSHLLVYVPQHRINGTAWLNLLGYRLAVMPQWVGKRYINASNTAWLPAYSTTDISLSKTFDLKFQSSLSVSLAVINAFDNPYQNMAHRPNPGRYFSLTLKFTRF
jgi:iron complex outermembrane receptor protein